MAAGESIASRRTQGAMAEINGVPLVDVMLVMLVIFIVTAPLLTHAVKVELPKASSVRNVTPAEHIEFAIVERGHLYWNGGPVSERDLGRRFALEARKHPQPELHLRVDQDARYRTVASVMSEATRAGLSRIAFVTDPSQP